MSYDAFIAGYQILQGAALAVWCLAALTVAAMLADRFCCWLARRRILRDVRRRERTVYMRPAEPSPAAEKLAGTREQLTSHTDG